MRPRGARRKVSSSGLAAPRPLAPPPEPAASNSVLGMPLTDEHSDVACTAKVTSLLNEASAGDPSVSAELLPLVYDQLRALAGRKHKKHR